MPLDIILQTMTAPMLLWTGWIGVLGAVLWTQRLLTQ